MDTMLNDDQLTTKSLASCYAQNVGIEPCLYAKVIMDN